MRLDRADDALRAGGEIGDRVAIGLDLEWEVGPDGPPTGTVSGEVLVGRARHEIDGRGWFYDDGVADPEWVTGETVAVVLIPVGERVVERRLVRTDDGLRWSLDRRVNPR